MAVGVNTGVFVAVVVGVAVFVGVTVGPVVGVIVFVLFATAPFAPVTEKIPNITSDIVINIPYIIFI
jgi:hypothetical protein